MDGDARLVPVGHDLGAFHDGSGGQCQQVRVGAHGTPDSDGVVSSVTASSLRAAHGDEVVDELLSKQLVAAVDPAVEFASTHRLVPLVLGLGNSAVQAGVTEAEQTDPDQVLAGAMGSLPQLVAARAVCFDVRIEGLR